MNPIEITGLTKKQVMMLDILWSLQTPEEIILWVSTLDDEDQTMALALLKLLHAEMIDQYVNEDTLQDAQNVLERFRKT